jgi:hypothetical protein
VILTLKQEKQEIAAVIESIANTGFADRAT